MPIYSFVEYRILDLPIIVSIKARLIAITIIYLGFGFVIARLRDKSKKFFFLKIGSKFQKYIIIHDLLFNAALNFMIAPLVYFISGAVLSKIISGTLFTIIVASFTGIFNGFALDFYRELFLEIPSNRFGSSFAELNKFQKRFLGLILIFLTIILIFFIYYI